MRVAAMNNKLRIQVRGFHGGNVLLFDGTVGELKGKAQDGSFESSLRAEATSTAAYSTRSYDAIVRACDGSLGSPAVIIHITDAEENSSSSTLADVGRALDARPNACPFYHVTNGGYRDKGLIDLLSAKKDCHHVTGGDLSVSLATVFKETCKIMKRGAHNKVSHDLEVETEISITEARTVLQHVLNSANTAVDLGVAMQGDDVTRRVEAVQNGRAARLPQHMDVMAHAATVPLLPPTSLPPIVARPANHEVAAQPSVQVFHAQVYPGQYPTAQYGAPYGAPPYGAPYGNGPYGYVPYGAAPYGSPYGAAYGHGGAPFPQDTGLLEKLAKLSVSEKGKEEVAEAPPAYKAEEKKAPAHFVRIDGITEKVGKPTLREFAASAGITKVDGKPDKFGVQKGRVKFLFPDEASAKMALDMLNGSKAEEMRRVFGSGARASYRG
jgi:hypothetical protein